MRLLNPHHKSVLLFQTKLPMNKCSAVLLKPGIGEWFTSKEFITDPYLTNTFANLVNATYLPNPKTWLAFTLRPTDYYTVATFLQTGMDLTVLQLA